ncbi:DUF4270 family protein [Parabacteroides sp. Marseille-P3160]|uniref:DUF4270 family protein n=1 Tax=Parabacteroides sp. Marseille-P3160 TaxID=1917887 RepID=UPI0009BB3840|nr:DUF4270 family protein [Parabacteroides sp. Marseille-P3160]
MYKRADFLYSLFLYLTLAFGISSCYDETNSYGKDLVESSFRTILIDSSTVTVTSVMIDSVETSAKGIGLVGRYTHPLWGKVISSAYIPYSHPSYSTDIEEVVELDSFVFSMNLSGYFIGDTTLIQQIELHQLKEKVVLNDNDYLYSNSSFNYDPTPLATRSFKPKPKSGESLEIRLPDALGKDLLTRFHRRDQEVSADFFEDYFKGIVILPGENSQTIQGLAVGDTASSLKLYYHLADGLKNSQVLVFPVKTANQFNHIDHDRKGTPLESYPTKQVEIPSAEIGNRGFLFGGIGWYTRLSFPYLNNLMQQGEQVEISQALLKIYPEPNTYSDFNPLPDSLFLYIVDENNVVINTVNDYLGTEVQGGVLVKDNIYKENTYYYFDVSNFMQDELGTIGKYKHNLLLVFDENDITKTFKNLTINDQAGRSPIVLQITYRIYESY